MGSPFSTKFFDKGASPISGDITQGDVYYVKPTTGSNSNDGTTPGKAFKTLTYAHSKMTANQNDICYFLAEAASDVQSVQLEWSKDHCHLIGVCAPAVVSPRCRITQLSTATGISPLLLISADGCCFSDLQIFQGVDDATSLIAVGITGNRNVFKNVHFAGIGNATQSASGCASLKLENNPCENYFYNCVIGLDTVVHDGDGVNLLLDTGATRAKFENCLFQMYVSAAGACHVKVADTTGFDRWMWFKDCIFLSESTNKTVDMTEVFNIPAGISQGKIILQNCAAYNDGGAPVWTAGTEGIIWSNMGDVTASAAGGLATNL